MIERLAADTIQVDVTNDWVDYASAVGGVAGGVGAIMAAVVAIIAIRSQNAATARALAAERRVASLSLYQDIIAYLHSTPQNVDDLARLEGRVRTAASSSVRTAWTGYLDSRNLKDSQAARVRLEEALRKEVETDP